MSSYRNILSGNGPEGTTEPEPAPLCAICGDWGWVSAKPELGSSESGKIEQCKCRLKTTEQSAAFLEQFSGIGTLDRMTFASADPRGRRGFADPKSFRAALENSENYAENPAGWLFITGVPGTGKTHLAAAIANWRVSQGLPVKYEQCPALLDKVRQSGNQPLYDALSVPLLILDDLGMHTATPWAESILGRLLNKRYLEHMPTVVVSDVEINTLGLREQAILQDSIFVKRLHIYQGIGKPSDTEIDVGASALNSMTFRSFRPTGRNASAMQKMTLEGAKEAASTFAEDPNGWLYLSGRTGVGKTHLAVAIANTQMEFGRPIVFKFVPDMLDGMRRTFDREADTDFHRLLSHFKETELLILDDLGSQLPTPWSEEKLYQILVHRHDRRLPTVITSRILLDSLIEGERPSFSAKYEAAMMSRLRDAHVVHERFMDAPDYRNRGEERV